MDLPLMEGGATVRWEALFADLEMQWEAAEAAEFDAELADRSRREAGYLRLVDRLRPAVGHVVRCAVVGGVAERAAVTGRLAALGVDWLLVEESPAQEALVPMRSVLSVQGLGGASVQPGHEGTVGARLDLRYALRSLVRDRAMCTVVFVDGAVVTGTPARVGDDFIELVEHPGGEIRPAREGRSVYTIPITAIAFIRRV
jgi:hypothetical protein